MGTVIGIFSIKGGVGKTLLATNLAVAFGVGYHRKTILIDLNKGNGTSDLLLDVTPDRSWADLVAVFKELTSQHINLAVTEYRPGLDLLASPPEMVLSETINAEDLSLLLVLLKKEYDLIVLDTPPCIASSNIGFISLADIRLLLLTPDMPSLRSTSRFRAALLDTEMKNGLVINQYSPGSAIQPDEITAHLGLPIFSVHPIDQAGVWANICYGEPCVLRKSSKLGKSIRELSAKLLHMIDKGAIPGTNEKQI